MRNKRFFKAYFYVFLTLFAVLFIIQINRPVFEIYLTAPTSSAAARNCRSEKELNKLRLELKPIITDKDIKSYDWSTQTITFTDKFIKKQKELMQGYGTKFLNVDTEIDGFVVVVNGKRMYSGVFSRMPAIRASSYVSGITINVNDDNIMEISGYHYSNDKKEKEKDKIYNALKIKGKIKEEQ